MVRLKIIKCGGVNCYLLSRNGNSILIDTATYKYRDKILDICKKNNVRLIVLTHGHPDHIQNAAFLSSELDIPTAIGEGDEDLIFDRNIDNIKPDGLMGKAIMFFSNADPKFNVVPLFMPSMLLKEGDSLKEFGLDLKVVSLPGHTKGSIGLVSGPSIFVGDALMNIFAPSLPKLYEDRDEAVKSAIKIIGLGGKKIYFGHGNPVDAKELESLQL